MIKIKNNTKLATWILQIGLGLTVLWFGIQQLMAPNDWVGFLPGWAFSQTLISTTVLVYLNGIFETLAGLMLITNQFTKFISILLTFHMALIIFHLGYNDIAVRDFGLMAGYLSLIFLTENKSIIKKFK